jgi:hypothetical protein
MVSRSSHNPSGEWWGDFWWRNLAINTRIMTIVGADLSAIVGNHENSDILLDFDPAKNSFATLKVIMSFPWMAQ